VTNVKRQKSISDFSKFAVIGIYSNRPLSASDPVFLEIIKSALRHCTQNESAPRLVPVRKRSERRLRRNNQVDKGITATKEVNEW
jgi:hypothetical protein